MKRILFSSVIFCLLLPAITNGQTERGRYLLGGSADISGYYQWKNSGFNLSFAPSFGVFVVKGLVIGGRYSFGINNTKNYSVTKSAYVSTTTFTSGIGPLVKYYIGKKNIKGLISANVNYLTSVTLRDKDVSGTNGYSATGLVGIAHFFNPHVSIECGLYVAGSGYMKQLPITRIGFSVGLFAFLDKKKKE